MWVIPLLVSKHFFQGVEGIRMTSSTKRCMIKAQSLVGGVSTYNPLLHIAIDQKIANVLCENGWMMKSHYYANFPKLANMNIIYIWQLTAFSMFDVGRGHKGLAHCTCYKKIFVVTNIRKNDLKTKGDKLEHIRWNVLCCESQIIMCHFFTWDILADPKLKSDWVQHIHLFYSVWQSLHKPLSIVDLPYKHSFMQNMEREKRKPLG